ncbi:unnamed protein product [Musa acuminata var. zebrina]
MSRGDETLQRRQAAAVEHAGLSGGRIECAAAVLLHSLALVPRAASAPVISPSASARPRCRPRPPPRPRRCQPRRGGGSRKQVELSPELDQKPVDLLKDDFVVVLHARDNLGFHVARQRVSEMAGSLDTTPNAAKRDPAAKVPSYQHLFIQDILGLQSFSAGYLPQGLICYLLYIIRSLLDLGICICSHSLDVWNRWMLEGCVLEHLKLV